MSTTRHERGESPRFQSRRGARGALVLAAILLLVPATCPADPARTSCDDGWLLAVPEPTPAKPTTLGGISGIVELARGRWLVAHDAKRRPGDVATRLHLVERGSAEVRLGTRRLAVDALQHTPVAWPGTLPHDLEALALLPGASRDVLAIESGENAGILTWHQIRVVGTTVQVLGSGTLAGEPPQVEGFALARVGGRLRAVWAGRGSGPTPARVRWGDVERDAAGLVTAIVPAAGHVDLVAPALPRNDTNTRHVSGLAVACDGTVWASGAVDPGNAGPFASVVYSAGRLVCCDQGVTFRASARPCLWCSLPCRKVEGLLLTPRGPLLATDDENFGGWLRLP